MSKIYETTLVHPSLLIKSFFNGTPKCGGGHRDLRDLNTTNKTNKLASIIYIYI